MIQYMVKHVKINAVLPIFYKREFFVVGVVKV